MTVYKITIGNHSYFVQGSKVMSDLEEIAVTIGLKYDKIEKTPLSFSQKIIHVWSIGELKDYLDEHKRT